MSLAKINNVRKSRLRKVRVEHVEPGTAGPQTSVYVARGRFETGNAPVRFAVEARAAGTLRELLSKGARPTVRIADWQVVD